MLLVCGVFWGGRELVCEYVRFSRPSSDEGEMINAFIEGNLSTNSSFFTSLVEVKNQEESGSHWSWMSRKEIRPHNRPPTPKF